MKMTGINSHWMLLSWSANDDGKMSDWSVTLAPCQTMAYMAMNRTKNTANMALRPNFHGCDRCTTRGSCGSETWRSGIYVSVSRATMTTPTATHSRVVDRLMLRGAVRSVPKARTNAPMVAIRTIHPARVAEVAINDHAAAENRTVRKNRIHGIWAVLSGSSLKYGLSTTVPKWWLRNSTSRATVNSWAAPKATMTFIGVDIERMLMSRSSMRCRSRSCS